MLIALLSRRGTANAFMLTRARCRSDKVDFRIGGGTGSISDHAGGKNGQYKQINRVERKKGAVDTDNSMMQQPSV